jgi:hypothetical protein
LCPSCSVHDRSFKEKKLHDQPDEFFRANLDVESAFAILEFECFVGIETLVGASSRVPPLSLRLAKVLFPQEGAHDPLVLVVLFLLWLGRVPELLDADLTGCQVRALGV